MKKLCIANPVPCCSSGNLSATNARNGSMLTLIEASRIHNNPAAIHNALQFGIAMSASELRMAPMRK